MKLDNVVLEFLLNLGPIVLILLAIRELVRQDKKQKVTWLFFIYLVYATTLIRCYFYITDMISNNSFYAAYFLTSCAAIGPLLRLKFAGLQDTTNSKKVSISLWHWLIPIVFFVIDTILIDLCETSSMVS